MSLIQTPSLHLVTIDWRLERFDVVFSGPSGNFQTAELPGARWRCRLEFPNMPAEDAGPLESWLAKASSKSNRFLLGKVTPDLRGLGGGSPVVRGGGQSGRSIQTEGWPEGVVILRAGDMIQLGGNRLHIVTADVTSAPGGIIYDEDGNPLLTELGDQILVDGAGRASIPIEPPIMSAPPDQAPIAIGPAAKGVFMIDGAYRFVHRANDRATTAFDVVQDTAWAM